MIHLYYGDGKGKTSAALGLAIRAAGDARRVLIVQFLKNSPTSELNALSNIAAVRVLRGTAGGFVYQMSDEAKLKTREMHNANLQAAVDAIRGGEIDCLVLDEVIDAYEMDMLDRTQLLCLLENAPTEIEIILTGHSLPEELVRFGDYITHMVKIKHPHDAGVKARKGVEY